MKAVKIRSNRTQLLSGAFGGANSHRKIADDSDSTYVVVTSNRSGNPAQRSPEWWSEQSMPQGKIVRVRMGMRVRNRGVVGTAYMRFASNSKLGIKASPTVRAPFTDMPAMASRPGNYYTPWAYKPWGLNRDWLPSDLEKFLVVPGCMKWAGKTSKAGVASPNSLGDAHIISIWVVVEYATATNRTPYDIKPSNGSTQVNPRPYLEAKITKHPDGIKQRIQFDILGKDANGKFTKVLTTRYSAALYSGTGYGYYGGANGFPDNKLSHPQGVYQIRARAVSDTLTTPGPWSKPQAFTVRHAPKALDLNPSANQTLGWSTTRLFKWKFQDPWTADAMSSYRIQVFNSNTNTVLVDTGDKTDFTLVKAEKPTKANSASYTAPANITYQATVAMPIAAKGVQLKWRILVKDKEGVSGSWTTYVPFAMAENPSLTIDQPYAEPDNGAPLFKLNVTEPDPITKAKTIEVSVKEKRKGTTVYKAIVNVKPSAVVSVPTPPPPPEEPAKPVRPPIVVRPYAELGPVNAQMLNQDVYNVSYRSDGVYSFKPKRNFMVNDTEYIISAKITAGNGLTGSTSKNVKAIFVHPTPVNYDLDFSRLDVDGGVHIDWSQAIADEDFESWKVYRMMDGEDWTLIYETDNEFVRSYVDFMFTNDKDYLYTVTQTAERDGSLLESPLGYRGVDAEDRMNLSTNPGFEFDLSNWSMLYSGSSLNRRSVNWSIEDAPVGMPEERATYTQAAGTTNMLLHKVVLPVNEPSHIYASVMVHSPQAYRWAGLSVSYVDANGAVVAGGSDGGMTELDRYSWTQVTLPPTPVPANAYAAVFGISVSGNEDGLGPVPGQTEVNVAAFLADAGNPNILPNYDFFDGDSIGAIWDGTRGVSMSVLYDNAVPEDQLTHVRSSMFMLINLDDPDDPRGVAMHVTDHSFKDSIEREVSNIMGRGRHVNLGTRLGYEGSFTAQLRGVGGEPTLLKNVLIDFYLTADELYLRSTYDMLIRVSIDSPDFKELAGTGENQMLDVTVNYVEVYEESANTTWGRIEVQ